MAIEIPSVDDTLHVVGENILRDAHHVECMDHAYEQVLLLGVGKEFNVHLPAVMTDHCETGYLELVPVRINDPCEAPVHLESFSRIGLVTTASVALRSDLLTFSRNKILVIIDVILDRCEAACITDILKLLKDHH